MTESKLKLDYYDIVRQKLAVGPLQAPKHEKIFELLKVFWDEDTVKVLAHFPNAGETISLEELAEKSGMEKKQIRRLLKKATKKKTLSQIGKEYSLEPLAPGIFEAYFISSGDTPENTQKAAEIFRWLFKNVETLEAEGHSMIDKNWSFMRPLLPIESKEKLIKIDESVDAHSQVLPYELVEDLINKNEYFAKVPCQCRMIAEKSGEPCEVAPTEMGCFLTGRGAQAAAAFGWGTALTKEEAIEYIKETEKAGLIHCTSNSMGGEHLLFICNCCSCCCGVVHPTKQHDFKTLTPSNFQPQIDTELCILCKTCLKKCPLDAITYKESPEEKMVINYDVCVGCGVCAANCKKNALTMKKVHDNIPPKVNKIGDKMFMQTMRDLLTS